MTMYALFFLKGNMVHDGGKSMSSPAFVTISILQQSYVYFVVNLVILYCFVDCITAVNVYL